MERERERVRILYEAAVAGDVMTLLMLLNEDSRVIDKSIVAGCCSPLHVATRFGHLEFVKEIIKRKPVYIGLQDIEGASPLHLAASYGHLEVVKALISVDTEICLVKDHHGQNPLHASITRGKLEVVREMVRAKPDASLACTDQEETVLHLCVKNHRLEILQFLLETLESLNNPEILNRQNYDGFTVLHLAVAEKQAEIIRYLVEKTATDINMLNGNGYTTLDIVLAPSRRNHLDSDIIDILRLNGAINSKVGSTSSPHRHKPGTHGECQDKMERKTAKPDGTWLEKKQNTLMIVASLIATIAYQSVINPPSADPTVAILSMLFLVCNTLGFIASILVILLLISGLPYKRKFLVWALVVIMWVALLSMLAAYRYALVISLVAGGGISYAPDFVNMIPEYALDGLVGVLLLGHLTRLVVRAVRFVKNRRASST